MQRYYIKFKAEISESPISVIIFLYIYILYVYILKSLHIFLSYIRIKKQGHYRYMLIRPIPIPIQSNN